MGHSVRRTEFVGQLIAADAMTSFQGTWRIVQAGVNNAAIARTRSHPNIRKGFKNEHITPAHRESLSNRATHDTAPDNDNVGLIHDLRPNYTMQRGSRSQDALIVLLQLSRKI